MKLSRYTRRDFSVGLAAILPVFGRTENFVGLPVPEPDRNGISHTCENIHQEVVFKATRKRVYEALTDEKKFSQVIDFIMKGASTQISREVGGSFSIFGGVITGRHVELVPDESIVQAWREKDWPIGLYSIVRFQLDDQGRERNWFSIIPGSRRARRRTWRRDGGRITGSRFRSIWSEMAAATEHLPAL